MTLRASVPDAHAEAPGVHSRRVWSFRPESDRQSGDAIVANFVLHWFPAKSDKRSLDWSYSFWLGTVSAALMLLLVLSGTPLLFLYVPSVERAYASVKDIEFVVTFGSWIRSVHRISAHLMVVAVLLHLVRVFLSGAYKNGIGQGQRREWNWVIGVGMLLLTLFLSFTGYLLPWDQLAYWAVTVGTNIASAVPAIGPSIRELLIGGRTIDQPTLIRFYVLHVIVLPGVLGALFGYHMWRIRKDGGLARSDTAPRPEAPAEVPPSPDEDLHAAGRRARHLARDSRDLDRGAGRDGQLGSRPHAARADRHARHDRRRQHPVGARTLAARGGGKRAGDTEPGQGAVVFPLASGTRDRHDDPPRLVHDQRGVDRRSAGAGRAGRRCSPCGRGSTGARARPPGRGSPRPAGCRTSSSWPWWRSSSC